MFYEVLCDTVGKTANVPTFSQGQSLTCLWYSRAIGFLGTAPFGLAAVRAKFAEVQRLNGEAYGKGIYAATDLNYGKGFGRILEKIQWIGTNHQGKIEALAGRFGPL